MARLKERFIEMIGSRALRAIASGIALWSALSACTSQNPRDRFLLAEKLWQEKNYSAAVAEYEKVTQKNPSSELGIQASLRAAMTQTLFLGEHLNALRKLNRIIEVNRESPWAHEAYKQIGEILFTRLEQYEQAIQHYERMLDLFPEDPSRDEYMFRVGKAQFYLYQFDQSILTFQTVKSTYPQSPWGKRSVFEIGVSEQTKGHQLQQKEARQAAEAFKKAIDQFTRFIREYPEDPLTLEAKFEIGNCYEELDQVDAASKIFEEIRSTYPNQSVIELKLKRLQERRTQKKL